MSADTERAKGNYELAAKKVRACMIASKGGADAEAAYSDAYDRLAKLGVVRRLRRKYRRR